MRILSVHVFLLFLPTFALAFQQSLRRAPSLSRLQVSTNNDYLSTFEQTPGISETVNQPAAEPSTQADDFDIDTAIALAKASEAAYQQDYRIADWAEKHGYEFYQAFEVNDLYGFMAWNEEQALLSFRGSENRYNWLRNLKLAKTDHEWGSVHRGFKDGIYSQEMGEVMKVFQEIAKDKEVTITGHSLGGALAVLAASRYKIETGVSPTVYTFGQPLVGDEEFAARFTQELPYKLYRVINKKDIVPRIPPAAAGYHHTGHPKRLSDTKTPALNKMFGITSAEPSVPVEGAVNIEPNFGTYFDSQSSNWRQEPPVRVLDYDAEPLSMEEFETLQESLGPGDSVMARGMLGDNVPYYNDHKISEYIEMLEKLAIDEDFQFQLGGQ